MSNLSELLPAGAGAKSADFVASGTLGSGVTVALKSDGTVTGIASVSAAIGTPVVFENANSSRLSSTYHPVVEKVVVFYSDGGNSNYGTYIVGTVSGTSISFGTPAVFESALVTNISSVYDTASGNIVVVYKDAGNSNYGTAIVGSLSGTVMSFGAAVVFSSSWTLDNDIAYDSVSSKVVIGYRNQGSSGHGTAIVGTVSGTSISFGAATVFSNSDTASVISAVYDTSASKILLAYSDSNSPYNGFGTSIIGTVSGTSISFGSEVVFNSGATNHVSAVYDSTSQKVVICYSDTPNSESGTAIVGTVSGTSVTYGTAVVYEGSNSVGPQEAVYSPNAGKVTIFFRDYVNPTIERSAISGTVSGTTISFDPKDNLSVDRTDYWAAVYDDASGNIAVSYQDNGNAFYGTSLVYRVESTNNTDFIGITDQAIADTATGAVIVQGGVITNTGLIPYELSAGAQSVYKVGPQIQWQAVAYDSTNNKVVVAYSDNNSTGKAAVGTISGTTITWGTPVQFSSHNSPHIAIAYDTNAQKIVIGYKDNASAPYGGQAVVGTVSGTSISFGSPVQFAAFDMTRLTMTYDANAQKTVFAYLGQSNYTQAIVGTVSGTSISFGTAYTVLSEASGYKGITYDSTAQKVVLATQSASTTGKAAVGTVSGTNISFGTAATFVSTQISQVAVSYNAAANKTLICYRADGLSNQGKTFVATVSGTSISFGAISEFDAGGVNAVSATYDVAAQTNVISFRDEGNSNYGTSIAATITGTTATYSSPLVFYAGAIEYSASTYSTTSNRIVVVYKDTANNNQGAANSLALSNALTPNTAYFVQDDGTISTTSSTTKAGTALSTTSLLLTG